nr:hypothetical protein 2 [Desulfobulbaceae bacterium]
MKKINLVLVWFRNSLFCLIASLAVIAVHEGKVCAQDFDLTGYWESDQGAIYQFRQVGDTLFWYVDFLPAVENVFYGTINGKIITGQWADLPAGTSRGQGTLALEIETNNRIVKITQIGNYGGTYWQRTTRQKSIERRQSSAAAGSTGTQPGQPLKQSSPCGDYPGEKCYRIFWRQGGGGTFSFYEENGRCLYDEVEAGDRERRKGELLITPDPANPGEAQFTMKDSWSKRGNPCTFKGTIVGRTLVEKFAKSVSMSCADGWNSDCRLELDPNQGYCGDLGLTTGKVQASDLVPLFDAVTGLGQVWIVKAPDGWRAIWRRQEGSDIFNGEWHRGDHVVQTVLRIERVDDQIKATRIKSSDGYRCKFEGRVKGATVEGTQRCAAPNQDYRRPAPFQATIH